ncbi:hypothetical protein GOV06_01450 [Candidatus Woesearchaeota archaeon]|nr:hypothetical protein [Candidatus Woesearchaeota archaeon]
MAKKTAKKKEPTWDDFGKFIEKKFKASKEKENGFRCKIPSSCSGSGGCFYFLGFIGAVIYYISTATGFWMGVLGVLKALVWPAFIIFELLKFLGA